MTDEVRDKIDSLLKSLHQRDAKCIEVRTVGDLWMTLHYDKVPCVAVSAIAFGQPNGHNIVQPKFPKAGNQSKWDALDRVLALCDAEGGNRVEAIRKLIGRIAVERGVDRREVINMPLCEFVAAAVGGDVKANEGKPPDDKPRRPATVNERMAGTITKTSEAMSWNCSQWAQYLKCGKSTVVETPTWKKLKLARLKVKAEKMKDKRRKPKASDRRD